MIKDFYIFRHGETFWNQQHKLQGSTDIELNDNGRNQAHDLSERLTGKGIEVIYSSHLKRAFETAQIVSEKIGVAVHQEQQLREASFGDVEGCTFDDVIEKYGKDLWESFRISNPIHNQGHFPNAESPASVYSRVRGCLEKLIDHKYKVIGISTHGAVIRNFIHPLIEEDLWPLPIPNCGIFHVRFEKGDWNYLGLIED